jgi:PIN domain nuclease of toxin-antitoxin system
MVLLDTHACLWSQTDPKRLSRKARAAIARAQRAHAAAISVFSVYELACLLERGHLRHSGSREAKIRLFLEGYLLRPLTPEIAALATEFPSDFPRDPGDRIITATARHKRLPLITADQRIRGCALLRTIW